MLFCVDKPARAVLHCGFSLSEKSICQCHCCMSGQWFGGWALTFSRAPKFTSAPSGAQFKVKVSELTELWIKVTWQESTARWFTQVGKRAATEIREGPVRFSLKSSTASPWWFPTLNFLCLKENTSASVLQWESKLFCLFESSQLLGF